MARMEHFAIFATDPKSLKDFYIQVMGLRLAVDNGAASPPGYFLVDDAGVALEIIGRHAEVEACDTRYVCHVAFTVDDVADTRHRLEHLGRCFEADTAVDTPEMKTAFFRDPEGHRLQIVWRARPLGS
ncbi:MAG TPA: VOC family protein [Isosphaeraceae bacterium]